MNIKVGQETCFHTPGAQHLLNNMQDTKGSSSIWVAKDKKSLFIFKILYCYNIDFHCHYDQNDVEKTTSVFQAHRLPKKKKRKKETSHEMK